MWSLFDVVSTPHTAPVIDMLFGHEHGSLSLRGTKGWQSTDSGLQLGDYIGILRGDIFQFIGIGIVVVEFSLAVTPKSETPAGSADALGVEFRVAGD